MAITVSAGTASTFAPCPAGVHQAVCVDVVDLGLLEVTFANETKTKHMVRIAWQIEELTADGKPFLVQKRYTASLHEKAQLRKDLESWRGRAFTDDELRAFDLEKLIGVNALINVMQVARETGKTYANVTAVMPTKKGMPLLKPRDYVRVCDRPVEGAPAVAGHEDGVALITEDDIPF